MISMVGVLWLLLSILTPYYDEDVLFSIDLLDKQNEDGVSILFYLQKIFPDEWKNFLERVDCPSEEDLKGNTHLEEELRLWASYRGQTLTKTGKLWNFRLFLICPMRKAVADMKFTYVVSCQQYGIQKRFGDCRATDILRLMTKVAYVDEVEETGKNKSTKTVEKVYYSVLVKASPKSVIDSSDPNQKFEQVIYKIKFPGPGILGEGKLENQNHAIIFTRGEGLQTIDMNQEFGWAFGGACSSQVSQQCSTRHRG